MFKQNILQNLIEKEADFNKLSKIYQNIDTSSYSDKWNLFEFQENAIQNAISVLYLYFNKLEGSKEELLELYKAYGLNKKMVESLNIDFDNENFDLLNSHFETSSFTGEEVIHLRDYINRMSFWMATGSGKTLVMIKLIEVLAKLINKGLIPKKDILLLAPKEEILEQIKEHIDKFNSAGDLKIKLNDLRDFENVKEKGPTLFTDYRINIFYYRADNITDENKEKLINYRSYHNEGNWYLFLDEAHKGEEKESVRQQYYKIFTQNGFLFNFSATFTDPLDKMTTCYDLKLPKYIKKGYGKHLKLANSTFSNFDKEEFENEDRKRIILKSLILFTGIKKYRNKINEINPDLYHEPLLTTLTNEVNTDDAELKVFFRELAQIAKQDYDVSIIKEIRNELSKELYNNPKFYFENNKLDRCFIEEINDVTQEEILRYVFNSKKPGNIEVTKIKGNEKELAFSTVYSNKPFACIVIGNTSQWKNDELEGYFSSTNVFKDSFLENIEGEDSNINILMGSRVFTEGWDTNRLNLINYINIGMSEESQKYLLQSIGRGARIEPIADNRKRLNFLRKNLKDRDDLKKVMYNNYAQPLETLFIFSTNKTAVNNIIEGLEKEREDSEYKDIKGFQENENVTKINRPIPVYKKTDQRIKKPYSISKNDYQRVRNYVKNYLKHIPIYTSNSVKLKDILYIEILDKKTISSNDKFIEAGKDSNLSTLELLKDICIYFNQKQKKLSKYKTEQGEIKHHKNIVTALPEEEIKEIENKIKDSLEAKRDYLKEKSKNDTSTALKYIKEKMEMQFSINGQEININAEFLNHYYHPIIYSSEKEINNYFKNIITVESEVGFLQDLNSHLQEENNAFKDFDWWGFSKLQEREDEVFIPYFHRDDNQYRIFYPDFIFWMKLNNTYKLIFIDPKGVEHLSNPVDKIQGYEDHLKETEITYEDCVVETKLRYYNDKKPVELKERYDNYWSHDFYEIFTE